ncbi:MAG: hypothetical protein ACKOPT_15195 [Cyanobium sp.]
MSSRCRSSFRRAYGRAQVRSPHGRHYLCVCVRSDVFQRVQELSQAHQLSLSGAAHHLLRLGAGLDPLLPLFNESHHGD